MRHFDTIRMLEYKKNFERCAPGRQETTEGIKKDTNSSAIPEEGSCKKTQSIVFLSFFSFTFKLR
uniref:Uncharacterized protein n=1 Tax=Romanomermis culicivorax TaxID=13658 RepID=A0A915KI42_ROMCU